MLLKISKNCTNKRLLKLFLVDFKSMHTYYMDWREHLCEIIAINLQKLTFSVTVGLLRLSSSISNFSSLNQSVSGTHLPKGET